MSEGREIARYEVDAVSNTSFITYVFDQKVLGARFGVGALISAASVDVQGEVVQPVPGPFSDSAVGFADLGLMPFSFWWESGEFSFNLYQFVVVPTADYDADDGVNIGLNRWVADTTIAVTWQSPSQLNEVSVVAGYIINGENKDTDYQTGDEVHVQLMLNRYINDRFGVGLQAYLYSQVEADSGSGALIADYQGSSYGVGPSLLWVPGGEDGDFSVSLLWLHDLTASDRSESDYAVVSLNWY